MAIEKTNFTATSQSANKGEVLSWLQANASEFFDTIEADSGGNILCKIGSVTALKLGFDGSTQSKATLQNGTTATLEPTSDIFSFAVKTSKGIFLNSDNFGGIFLTKSNTDSTIIIWNIRYFTSNYSYTFADLNNSISFFKPRANDTWANSRSAWVISADCTSLTHVVTKGNTYAPHAYIQTFSEYALTKGILDISGSKYWTDGVVALAE